MPSLPWPACCCLPRRMKTKFLSFFLLLCFGWQQAPAAGSTPRPAARSAVHCRVSSPVRFRAALSGSRAWTPRASGCASTPRWGSPITRSASRTCGPCTTRCVPSLPPEYRKGLHRAIFQQARSAGADPDGLPHRCRVQETAAQEEGRALRQPFAAAARRPPVLARSSRGGLPGAISRCGRATDAISTSLRTAGNGSVRGCG